MAVLKHLFLLGILPVLVNNSWAMDPQPRQWSHLPMGASFLGIAYAKTTADIYFDPALSLQDVEMDIDTIAFKYIYGFEMLGKSARVDVVLPYQHGHWKGRVDGVEQAISRKGMADSIVRVGINLLGAPALNGKHYLQYRLGKNSETIIGTAMVLRLPTGQYDSDKLINLGNNRYSLRPQLGVTHMAGSWTAELTAELSLFSDNTDFNQGQRLEEEALYFVHAHIIYSFRPGVWLSASTGFDDGGKTRVNGKVTTEHKRNTGWALSAAYPINKKSGLRLNYVATGTREDTGLDSNTTTFSYSHMF
ncbi:MAG: transporter [Pseudomonadales bacterium]|nr:transporter [Pseudomonadales bacterium]